MKIFLTLLTSLFLFFSCSTDDDICTDGEGTPQVKIKFKTFATGKPRTLDSVFVAVDYGAGPVAVVQNTVATDSLMLPLRVEDVPFTDIYVATSSTGNLSQIRLNYTTTSEYVSPACGIRRLYTGLSATLQAPNPVLAVDTAQNEIVNESKTHLFLLF